MLFRGVDVALQRAVIRVVPQAFGDELVDRLLETAGLRSRNLVDVVAGVQHAIQDEAPDALGEQVGVDQPQEGPVGKPQEVQPVLAQGGAHNVQVSRGVVGGGKLGDFGGALLAFLSHLFDRGDGFLASVRGGGVIARRGVGIQFLVGAAMDGGL